MIFLSRIMILFLIMISDFIALHIYFAISRLYDDIINLDRYRRYILPTPCLWPQISKLPLTIIIDFDRFISDSFRYFIASFLWGLSSSYFHISSFLLLLLTEALLSLWWAVTISWAAHSDFYKSWLSLSRLCIPFQHIDIFRLFSIIYGFSFFIFDWPLLFHTSIGPLKSLASPAILIATCILATGHFRFFDTANIIYRV